MRHTSLRGITLHQLEVFATVAQEEGFARAAEQLYLSEAAVSEQVKNLETVFGLRLLERSRGRRGIALTDAGRAFLRTCNDVFATLEAGAAEVRAMGGAVQGLVRLAVSPTFGGYFLPTAYEAFREAHPHVQVQVTLGRRPGVLQEVIGGTVDLAVISGPVQETDLAVDWLCSADSILVGPPGHRLAAGPPAPFRELADEPMIVLNRFSHSWQLLEQRAREVGVQLRVALELADGETLMQAVVGGLGIATRSERAVAQRVASGQIAALQVEGFPMAVAWYLVRRPGTLAPAVDALRTFLLNLDWPPTRTCSASPTGRAGLS